MGNLSVAQYRLYLVGVGARLQPAEVLDSADDATAVAHAQRRLTPGQAAELWAGGRLVGRFSKLGVFTAG